LKLTHEEWVSFGKSLYRRAAARRAIPAAANAGRVVNGGWYYATPDPLTLSPP
jgi:hypothetical protein